MNNNNSKELCDYCDKEATSYAKINGKTMYVCSQICSDLLYEEQEDDSQPVGQLAAGLNLGLQPRAEGNIIIHNPTKFQKVPTQRGRVIPRPKSPPRRVPPRRSRSPPRRRRRSRSPPRRIPPRRSRSPPRRRRRRSRSPGGPVFVPIPVPQYPQATVYVGPGTPGPPQFEAYPGDGGMTVIQYPGDMSPLESGNLNCFQVECPEGFPEGTKCWRCYELTAPNGSD